MRKASAIHRWQRSPPDVGSLRAARGPRFGSCASWTSSPPTGRLEAYAPMDVIAQTVTGYQYLKTARLMTVLRTKTARPMTVLRTKTARPMTVLRTKTARHKTVLRGQDRAPRFARTARRRAGEQLIEQLNGKTMIMIMGSLRNIRGKKRSRPESCRM
jgi:hypothetical protein